MYFWDKHKTVTSYYEVLSGEVCDWYGLTQMEYDILMFLMMRSWKRISGFALRWIICFIVVRGQIKSCSKAAPVYQRRTI